VGEAASGLTMLWPVGEGWETQFLLPFAGLEIAAPVVGDALGDGSIDLVVPGLRSADEALWLVSGLAAEGGPNAVVIEEGPTLNVVAIDLDGDAALDVAGTRDGELVVIRRGRERGGGARGGERGGFLGVWWLVTSMATGWRICCSRMGGSCCGREIRRR
jgi:hypothetical protein